MSYKKYIFGKKERVYIYLLDKPIENLMIGLVKSKIFKKQIGIHLQKDKEFNIDEVVFAGFYVSSVNNQPMIEASYELYEKIHSDAFLTTIFHEIGHYYYSDYSKLIKTEDGLRVFAIEQGKVLDREIKADEFAVKYLGKKRVLSGLEELIKLVQSIGDISDYQTKMCIKELKMRINHLNAIK